MQTKQVGKYNIDESSCKFKNTILNNNKIIEFYIKSLFDNNLYYGKFCIYYDKKSFVYNKPILEILWKNENGDVVNLNIDYFTNYGEISIYDLLKKRNICMNDFYVIEKF